MTKSERAGSDRHGGSGPRGRRGGSGARGRRGSATGPADFSPEFAPDLPPGEFLNTVAPDVLQKEKNRARELRESAWWKRKRAAGRCYYCRKEFSPGDLTMDHMIPLVRGGRSVKENLVPACKDCNNKKKYLLPTEWGEYLASLGGAHSNCAE